VGASVPGFIMGRMPGFQTQKVILYTAPCCFLYEGGHESAQGRLICWPSSFMWYVFTFTESCEQVQKPGIGSGLHAGEHMSEHEVNIVPGLA